MEILVERTKEGKERSAQTIRSIHRCYEITIDSEPTLIFRWDIKSERWEYRPTKIYPYTTMVLEPIEIAVRIPIDDTIRVQHYPYVINLVNPDLAIKMDKSIEKVVNMLEEVGAPKCVKTLKKALKHNIKRNNKYSI